MNKSGSLKGFVKQAVVLRNRRIQWIHLLWTISVWFENETNLVLVERNFIVIMSSKTHYLASVSRKKLMRLVKLNIISKFNDNIDSWFWYWLLPHDHVTRNIIYIKPKEND